MPIAIEFYDCKYNLDLNLSKEADNLIKEKVIIIDLDAELEEKYKFDSNSQIAEKFILEFLDKNKKQIIIEYKFIVWNDTEMTIKRKDPVLN